MQQVRRRNSKLTRENILRAATDEFAEYGYEGARVERIVGNAGCNMRMLYHHFENKENLYIEVLESVYVTIRNKEKKLKLASLEPKEALVKLVKFTWRHFLTNKTFIDITRNENLMGGKFIVQSKLIAELSSPLIAQISTTIERGLETGVFRHSVDPLQLYISIVALSSHHLSNAQTLSATFQVDLTKKKWRDERYKHIETMVMRMVGAIN